MKHIKDHVADVDKIPDATFRRKRWKTVGLGIGSIALGLAVDKWFTLSDWVTYSLLIFGGYSIAGDVVRSLVGFIPAAGRDIAEGITAVKTALLSKKDPPK